MACRAAAGFDLETGRTMMADMSGPSHRPLILLTNDDGIEAAGLAGLVAAVKGLGRVRVRLPAVDQIG